MLSLLTNKRLWIALLIVAAIVTAAVWPNPVSIDVVRAGRRAMTVTIDEDGETRVRQRFVVSAPVSGELQRIDVEPGDPVIKNETVLARLIPAATPLLDVRTRAELGAATEAARAALGQAQAERDRAIATVSRARSTLRRHGELAAAGAIPRDDLEAAQTAVTSGEEAVRAAEFAVSRAEYEVRISRARLQQPAASGGRTVTVLAPIDGLVLKRLRESESVVPVGEPLIELGDRGQMEIVADLLSTDAVRVPPGARVLIDQWGGSEPLEARVRRVEPSGFMKVSALGVEEQRVNVRIDFVDPARAARALGDGYRVEVRVVLWHHDSVLTAPVGALFRRGEGWAAFVVDGDRVRLQAVTLGHRTATDAEILGGVTAGQTLVLHPPDTLKDGMTVKAKDAH